MLGRRAFDLSGSLWLNAPPDLTFAEKMGLNFDIGFRSNMATQWAEELTVGSKRVKSFLAKNEDDSRILSPEEVATEFPEIQTTAKSSMRRAEARYLAERDQREVTLRAALQGRSSGLVGDTLPALLGGLGAGAMDPFAWTAAMLPAFLPFQNVSRLRKMVMAAKAAKMGPVNRLVLGGSSFLDAAIGEVAYVAAHAATSPMMNREYTAGMAANQILGAGTLGGLLGFTFPRHLSSIIGMSHDDISGVASLSTFFRALGKTDYKTIRQFLEDNTGAIDVSAMASFLQGRPTPIKMAPGITRKTTLNNAWQASSVTKLQEFVKTPAIVKNPFKQNLLFRGRGVSYFGGYKFKEQKTLFNTHHWDDWLSDDLGTVETVYAAIPRNNTDGGIAIYSDPVTAAIWDAKKNNVKDSTVIQLRLPGHYLVDVENKLSDYRGNVENSYFNLHRKPIPPEIWPGKDGESRWGALEGGEQLKILNAIRHSDKLPGYLLKDAGQGFEGWLSAGSYERIRSFSDSVQAYKMAEPTVSKSDMDMLVRTLDGKELSVEPPTVQFLEEIYGPKDVDKNYNVFYSQMEGALRLRDGVVSSGPYLRSTEITFKGTPVNAYDRLFGSGYEQLVLNWIAGKAKEWEGTPHLARVRSARTLHDVIQAVGESDLGMTGLANLKDDLQANGFVFGRELHPDRAMKHYYITQDAVIPKSFKTQTLREMAYTGKVKGNVKVVEPPGHLLDLTKHPRDMIMEEALLAKSMTREAKGVHIDSILNNSSYAVDPAKVFTSDVLGALGELGYAGVKWRVGKSGFKKTFKPGHAPDTQALKYNWERLKKVTGQVDEKPQGAKDAPDAKPVKDEQIVYFDSLYDPIIKGTYSDYIHRLISDMQEWLPEEIFTSAEKGIVRGEVTQYPFTAWRKQREELLQIIDNKQSQGGELASPRVKDAFRELKMLEHDIEKAHKTLSFINQGYVFNGDRFVWMAGDEILSMFKTQTDMPFHTMGGVHVESISKSMTQNLTAHLVSRIRQTGGDDLLRMFSDGVLDEDLLKIQHLRRELKGKEEANLSEELAKRGNVSENALRVEKVLNQVMASSQELLTQAGVYRSPREYYIGKRSYSRDIITSTPQEEFVADVMKHVKNETPDGAKRLYRRYAETPALKYDTNGVLNELQSLNKPRTLEFKSAEAEFAFRKKYGGAGHGLEVQGLVSPIKRALTPAMRGVANIGDSLYKVTGMDFFRASQSEIFRGALDSIKEDAEMAAVASVWGNRPFKTLELAHKVIGQKATKLLEEGKWDSRKYQQFQTPSERASNMSKILLESWVFGDMVGRGYLARSARIARSMTKASILPGTSPHWAFFGDMFHSVNIYDKLFRGEGKRNLRTFFQGIGKRFGLMTENLTRYQRREVGEIFNTAILADTQDYLSRFNADATGTATWLEGKAMRLGLAPWITDTGKSSNMVMWGMSMANAMKRPLNTLPQELQHVLGTHGIDDGLWNMVRGLEDVTDVVRGKHVFSLAKLEADLIGKYNTGQAREIYNKFATLLIDNAWTKSIIESSKYSKANLSLSNDPEHLLNIGLSLVLEFKAMMLETTWGLTEMRNYRRGKGNVGHIGAMDIAHLLAGGLMVGIAQLAARDLMAGRNPRLPHDSESTVQYFKDAASHSGFLGILGDYYFSDIFENKIGFVNFLGPTITGLGFETLQAGAHTVGSIYSERSRERVLRDWGDAIGTITPNFGLQAGLLLNTLFLDSLGDLSEYFNTPDQIRRRVQYHRERGSEYFAR